MKLIIGLGNPGLPYKNTRHNIGFQVLDDFLATSNLFNSVPKFKIEKKFKAEIFKSDNFILAKPQTFMNNSGQTVKALKNFFKIELENIIIVHDDIDLPIGTIRISQNSSSGGHKGLDSIISNIQSKNFIRLRIGIANGMRKKIPADKFVLQKFNPNDKKILRNKMPNILEALSLLIAGESLAKIQNKFN